MTLEIYKTRCPRFNFLARLLKDNSAVLDVASLEGNYRNRDSGINNESTYGCTIMVLGEDPELHIAAGRTDKADLQVLRFSPRPGR